MGKPRIITRSFTQFEVESYEGQSVEDRCKKLVETGEPIKDTSPLIYTPKDKDGNIVTGKQIGRASCRERV